MRPIKLLCFALPALILAAPAGAQVKLNFHEYNTAITPPSGVNAAYGDAVSGGGVDIMSASEFTANNNNSLGTWGYGDAGSVNRPSNLAPGAATLFIPNLSGQVEIVAAGTDIFMAGEYPYFGLISIDVAHLYSSAYLAGTGISQAAFTFRIFGSTTSGATGFFQDFLIPVPVGGTPLLQTLTLASAFRNVNLVWFNQSAGSGSAYQFTNVVVATPEPSSLILLASGLTGVFGMGVRRRRVRTAETIS